MPTSTVLVPPQLAFTYSNSTMEKPGKWCNLFKINNRDIRATSLPSFRCYYCQLRTNFRNCPNVSKCNSQL